MIDDPTREYKRFAAKEPFTRALLRYPDEGKAKEHVALGLVVIGSGEGVALRLSDRTVSRVHAELEVRDDGVWVRDLGSRNGTFVDHVQVEIARVPTGGRVVIGATSIEVTTERAERDVWPTDHFGPLLGKSPRMRELFLRLSKIAASDAPVLVRGETGTGKEVVARAIHDTSARARKPFVIVDCGALPANLLESELFGHARGAFTGAVTSHSGALEVAGEGTIFLDEIGELPLELQPKLLRALESNAFRRVGETEYRPITARFVAATHRDLGAMVNRGEFREDLFFRLNVLPIAVPPLRDRREDVPMLVDAFLRAKDAPPLSIAGDDLLSRTWPGNVRELRNFVERAVTLGAGEALMLAEAPTEAANALVSGAMPDVPTDKPYKDVRDAWLEHLERTYLSKLLAIHGGNVTAVADAAGLARTYVHRMLRKHGLGR